MCHFTERAAQSQPKPEVLWLSCIRQWSWQVHFEKAGRRAKRWAKQLLRTSIPEEWILNIKNKSSKAHARNQENTSLPGKIGNTLKCFPLVNNRSPYKWWSLNSHWNGLMTLPDWWGATDASFSLRSLLMSFLLVYTHLNTEDSPTACFYRGPIN